jgi:hypothetical protein
VRAAPAPPPPLVLVPEGEPARNALFAQIEGVQADDRLSPVTVAVPSTYAALSLRRALARRPRGTAGTGGLVGVRFVPLGRVAELLGAPFLAEPHRRPLTPELRAGALRGALADARGRLHDVGTHPATTRALAATFRDLDLAIDPATVGGARVTADLDDVLRCHRRYRELVADCYDDEDQLRSAARMVLESPAGLDDLGTLILHVPRALTPGGLALVAALAGLGRARAVLGLTGDARADRVVLALADRLASALGPPVTVAGPSPKGAGAPAPPSAEEIVS